jgi:hypothetical protein
MNFEVCKKEDKSLNYTVINLEKDCYKNIKKNISKVEAFELDETALGLSNVLYAGEGKKESFELQKKNCDNILKLYKKHRF